MIKIFLLHCLISFLNFIKEISELIINNKSFNELNDLIKRKIYEKFLFLPLKEHFQKITKKTLQRKNSIQSNIKYKDFLVIELESSNILFSLNSLMKKTSVDKITNYNSLYKELLYHINNLKSSYSQKFSCKFESSDYQDYFVKVEYTSTYPRLIFIIKFIPVLKGIALIYIYSQNKLSRNENENKVYKEFDIIYGNDVNKDSNHIEYRFNEPKIHKEIEMFFIEFYICINSSLDLFYYPKQDLKYFNFDYLMVIKNALSEEEKKNNISNLELILNAITNKLYEDFLLSKDNENKKKEEMTTKYLNNKGDYDLNILPIKEEKTQTFNDVDSILKKNEMMFSNYQWNFTSQNINTFQISKNFCFQILFEDLKNNDCIINPNEITINLTHFDEKSNNKSENLSEIIMKDYSYIKKTIMENSIISENKNNNFDFKNNKGKSFNNQLKNVSINKGRFIENKQENKSVILHIKFKSDFLNKEENENSKLLSYIENEISVNSKSERNKENSEN